MKNLIIREEAIVATKGMGDNKVYSTCSEIFIEEEKEVVGISVTSNDTDYIYYHEAATKKQLENIKKLSRENPDKFWEFFEYYAGPRDWNGNFPMIHRFEDKWDLYFGEEG